MGVAFLKAEALRETAGCLVADDDFERNDADLAHDGVAVGKLFYKVGLDAVLFKQLEHEVGHTVVDNTLANDRALLFAVECDGDGLFSHELSFAIGVRVTNVQAWTIYQR